MQTVDFQNGKLFPMILKFSIPAAVSLLISAVYNIVDRIFVGNFVGVSALAGLSVCFPLTYLMIAFALTCSAGGASLFSLFAGSGDRAKMERTFGSALTLVVVFELALTVVMLALAVPVLNLFGATETSFDYALAYYRIVALGCVFQGLTFVFCDFVRVSGRPVLGMLVTCSGAVCNIVLDALFVAVLGWGVEGAAWATVAGQAVSTVFGAFLALTGKVDAHLRPELLVPDWHLSGRIISCGFAFWVAQVAQGLISLVYNNRLGVYGGDAAISVYAVTASIMTFVIMPASGISQGIQPIVGNNYGAGKSRRVMQTLWLGTALSVAVTAVIWIAVMALPEKMLLAFGATQEMLDIGVPGLRANFCITPVLGFVMLVTTFFQSLGKPAPSIVLTLLRQLVILVPLIYLFPLQWGVFGIFLAQPVSDAIALVLAAVLVARERRTLLKSA